MVAKKNFEIGDLVWAKMKSFPYWPGKIVNPPPTIKPATPKKAQHCVFFFGSENYAWIPIDCIMHHTDEMLQSTSNKKKSASYKLAIEKISDESQLAPKKAKSPVKEKESPEVSTSSIERKINKVKKRTDESQLAPKKAKSPVKEKESPEVSTSSIERKIIKVKKPKVKYESPKVQKKTPSKRGSFEESANKRTSPIRRLSKSSASIPKTPPGLSSNVRQSDGVDNFCSSGYRGVYFDLPPVPPFDVLKASKAVQGKNIKPTDKKIGFIGLGMMGQRLVKILIATKHKIMVWNRSKEKCTEVIDLGAQLAQSPEDVVTNCDIIFSCVSGPDAAKCLVFGNCGILSGLEKCSPGTKGFVEMTTMDPATSREIGNAITNKGGKYLEAPFSGSRQMVEDGTIQIVCAGNLQLFQDCNSCFVALSKQAYFLSETVGPGSQMNLIMSMFVGISHAALAEAMSLIKRCNLSQIDFMEYLKEGDLNSFLLLEKAKAMQSLDFTPNTCLKYQRKDLSLALSLGNSCEQPMYLVAAANQLFKHSNLSRYSDHDVSAVYLGTTY